MFFFSWILGDPENFIPANPLVTPVHIQPEWYFLIAYAILRSIPNKLLGVVGMLASLLILLAMPVLDRSRIRGAQFRPLMKFSFWVFVTDFFFLMYIGSQHAEEPFVTLGSIRTAIYFGWFLILVPVIAFIENTLRDIRTREN